MKLLQGLMSLSILLIASANAAAEGRLTVTPSSTEITEDENVSLEFKVTSEGAGGSIGEPRYEAPDFDEINAYSGSQGIETSFINGQISVRQSKSLIYVLHPRKQGKLTISKIQVQIGGKTVQANDIVIDVRPAGTRLGRGSGGGVGYPPPSKLPGGGAHAPAQNHASTLFIRAEPSKLKAYKGEQIILTYALYTRVNILNVQVERYPNPSGFLKEDIDIPLLRGRLDYTPAVVNGHEYRRAVLAQYAIFPLREGPLTIDTFTAKFSFQTGSRGMMNEDDPFAMLNQFFKAMQTTTETRTSDRPQIEVMALPGSGQPAGFSGLVGDFDITAVADKTTVKAGEPVNIKVKVEGKGHAGSLEKLPIQFPPDFELYEDKSRTQFLRTGYSERLFEYMVVPKTKGHFEIPEVDLTMFNPDSHAYQSRKTQPITIEVLEGAAGNVYVPKSQPGSSTANVVNEDIRYWKDSISEGANEVKLRAAARGVAMASMVLAVLSLWSLGSAGQTDARSARQKAAQAMKARAKTLASSNAAPVEVLGDVEALLAELIEHQYGIAIGSLKRAEVVQALLSKGNVDETTAKRVENLVEHVENQRYAPGGGDKAGAARAVDELQQLIDRICS